MQPVQARQKRARRSRAQWVDEVRRWRQSGQAASQYAAEHDLHKGTLAWWGQQLGGAVVGDGRRDAKPKGQFLPVRIADRAAATTTAAPESRVEMELVLLNGRRIRINGEFHPEVLAQLLRVAEGGAQC
jgi:hypothetical protein